MARPSKDISVRSDKSDSGTAFFYVHFKGPDGKKTRRSTGIVDDGRASTLKRAEAEALDLVAAFFNQKAVQPGSSNKPTTFGELGANVWDWDGEFLKNERLRNDDFFSREYADSQNSAMTRHVIPFFGEIPITEITAETVDDFVTLLLKPISKGGKGLSKSTVKHAVLAMNPVFKLAIRRKLIRTNPTLDASKIKGKRRARDRFTKAEAAALLDRTTVDTVWGIIAEGRGPGALPCGSKPRGVWSHKDTFNPWVAFGVSTIAGITGARVSTVVPLTREDVGEKLTMEGVGDYYLVTMDKALRSAQGVTPGSKTGAGVQVPIEASILEPILAHLPKTGPLFAGRGAHGVVTVATVRRLLHKAMRRVGISEEAIKERKLGFHSFRHTFVTLGNAEGLTFPQLSGFTEHADEKTVRIYDHRDEVNLSAAFRVQAAVIGRAAAR